MARNFVISDAFRLFAVNFEQSIKLVIVWLAPQRKYLI